MDRTVVATVSMFEQLAGSKGKFTNAIALFEPGEPISAVMDWAKEHAAQNEREVIKVEVSLDKRDDRPS